MLGPGLLGGGDGDVTENVGGPHEDEESAKQAHNRAQHLETKQTFISLEELLSTVECMFNTEKRLSRAMKCNGSQAFG